MCFHSPCCHWRWSISRINFYQVPIYNIWVERDKFMWIICSFQGHMHWAELNHRLSDYTCNTRVIIWYTTVLQVYQDICWTWLESLFVKTQRLIYNFLIRSKSCINPILTGGVNLTPPCTKSATASRPPQIATRLFMTFFFQVLRIFWYQVYENRTIGREVTWRFVLARRPKICPKSAFCIYLCTKHMAITDFLKMHYKRKKKQCLFCL